MSDTSLSSGLGQTHSGAEESLRTYAIVVYVLFMLAAPSIFSSMLIGVALAYVKRGDARGTVFESHFGNAIEVFWVTLVIGIVALALWPLFLLGALVHAALFVWVIYRTVKGLVRAVEWRPYD